MNYRSGLSSVLVLIESDISFVTQDPSDLGNRLAFTVKFQYNPASKFFDSPFF